MKVNAYSNVARKASPNSNNTQPDKYKAFIKKLVQLRSNDWLIFLGLSRTLKETRLC